MNKNLDTEIYSEMMGEIISNLKNEIKELTFKVQKAREEGNWGTYRNLIISYKEVIQLYKEIVDKISEEDDIDKTQYVKNNMTIGLDKNTSKLINEAFAEKHIAIDNVTFPNVRNGYDLIEKMYNVLNNKYEKYNESEHGKLGECFLIRMSPDFIRRKYGICLDYGFYTPKQLQEKINGMYSAIPLQVVDDVEGDYEVVCEFGIEIHKYK